MRAPKNLSVARARRAHPGRRGTALPYVMLIVFSLMAISVAFHMLTLGAQRRTAASEDDLRAENLIQAAVAESMASLKAVAVPAGQVSAGGATTGGQTTGGIGSQAAPAYLDGGLFWVQATDLGNDIYQLDALAMAGRGRAAAQVVVERTNGSPLFDAVLNSREQLTVNSSVVIDSYESMLGTYASQATNVDPGTGHTYAAQNGDVSSNEGIVLNALAAVFGDAIPGPGYAVSMAPSAYVSGTTTSAPAAMSFPPIVTPAIPVTGNLVVPTGGSSVLPSGKHGLGALTIGKDASLLIQGPAEILVSDFTGGKDASLFIDATAGPVTIHVTNTYSHISGFEASPVTGSPMALAFMVTAPQDIVFPSNTNVRGAYYVPNSNILFASGNEVWGSFGANRIDMSNSTKFHYDESLQEYWKVKEPGKAVPVEVLSWTRVGVASAFRTNRRDPFKLLNVNAGALPMPREAWVVTP
jgi:hypothetical protein